MRHLYKSEIRQNFNSFNYDQLSTIIGREGESIEVTGLNNKNYLATWGYNKWNDGVFIMKRIK